MPRANIVNMSTGTHRGLGISLTLGDGGVYRPVASGAVPFSVTRRDLRRDTLPVSDFSAWAALRARVPASASLSSGSADEPDVGAVDPGASARVMRVTASRGAPSRMTLSVVGSTLRLVGRLVGLATTADEVSPRHTDFSHRGPP